MYCPPLVLAVYSAAFPGSALLPLGDSRKKNGTGDTQEIGEVDLWRCQAERCGHPVAEVVVSQRIDLFQNVD
jgi:hypothetical protein